jgi:hypothetical protein
VKFEKKRVLEIKLILGYSYMLSSCGDEISYGSPFNFSSLNLAPYKVAI